MDSQHPPACGSSLTQVDDNAWLERVARINQHRGGGERAPHKPLLILYALGRLQRERSSKVAFSEAEKPLGELLIDAGRDPKPQYPFYRLQSDGLWVVEMRDGEDPSESLTALRDGAVGQFAPEFEAALLESPSLIANTARMLLDREFPETLHEDILSAVGLSINDVVVTLERVAELRRRRDPMFRKRVLYAYEETCAFCGFDGLLERAAVGLEAAHVRWWAYEGPDDVQNGVCLCSLHHKLFDRGVMTVNDENRIAVSGHFRGATEASRRFVGDLNGQEVRAPQLGQPRIAEEHSSWHRDQVFRAPERVAG